jgi:hypothetical protein
MILLEEECFDARVVKNNRRPNLTKLFFRKLRKNCVNFLDFDEEYAIIYVYS